MFLSRRLPELPTPEQALGGRQTSPETADFGLECFSGAERKFGQTPGVWATLVGYQGGIIPNATYDEVCSRQTGRTEAVRVVFDPRSSPTRSS